ncbi:Uncharacterised protein [Yersinia similis]|uniref:Uncharacterized protein n=1 Tax=Yersinia similis TaxID=367190 RepID=A0A0T9RNR1_9GAMM|nr:Uncharacterised protein [Yersinia similis]CNI72195.1 Uncharacterised protein [Yersinia similis]
MNDQNLKDYLSENWKMPFKTLSFWILSIAAIILRDQLYNYDLSADSFFHRTNILDWLLWFIIIFTYIFAERIDNKIKAMMSN